MSDYSQSSQKVEEPENEAYENEEQKVCEYLLNNPDFFNRNKKLLQQIKLPHQQRGSVSLVEYQSENLRKRIRTLQRQLADLMSVAKENERLYRIYANLQLKLFECKDATDVQICLESSVQDELGLDAVVLKPSFGANALPELQKTYFREKRFKRDHFYFGRLLKHESQTLFADDDVKSVAMVEIGEHPKSGILAIGSQDENHFYPGMDTLFIDQLRKILTLLLPMIMDI